MILAHEDAEYIGTLGVHKLCVSLSRYVFHEHEQDADDISLQQRLPVVFPATYERRALVLLQFPAYVWSHTDL